MMPGPTVSAERWQGAGQDCEAFKTMFGEPPDIPHLQEWGEVVERLMALGCKPSVLRDYEGSNPSLSTSVSLKRAGVTQLAES